MSRQGASAPPPSKVARYRAGQVPKGVTLEESSSSSSEEEEEEEMERQKRPTHRGVHITAPTHVPEGPTQVAGRLPPPTSTEKEEEDEEAAMLARRARIRQRTLEASESSSREGGRFQRPSGRSEVPSRPRERRTESSDEEGEEERAMRERRARLRQNVLDVRRREEGHTPRDASSEHKMVEKEESTVSTTAPVSIRNVAVQESGDEGEREGREESSSGEDEESSSEDEYGRPMFKPVFTPKNQRGAKAVEEKVKMDANGLTREDREAEARYRESQRIVTEVIRQGQSRDVDAEDMLEVDDTDGLDDEGEFQAWRLRELKRIMQDREEREAAENEKAEVERRRNLTEEERNAEDAELLEGQKKGEEGEGSQRFLQKYYHKGAFYQDTDKELLSRDYQQPTEDEPLNRQALPKAQQVKKFGMAGQTKWTHLTNEDTTRKDAAWSLNTIGNKRAMEKMGGSKQEFDRPSAKKR